MDGLPQKISTLIEAFSELPGIGPKSAARVVFFLQKAPRELSEQLADSIISAKNDTTICKICYNLSESELCSICKKDDREEDKILVVEDALDLIAIEKTGSYKGRYHVLGGVISPMSGIGPEEIRIKELINRLKTVLKGEDKKVEIILATNPNMEGEATAAYIVDEIQRLPEYGNGIRISRLARGLSSGADIDFTDDTTIRKSIEGRVAV